MEVKGFGDCWREKVEFVFAKCKLVLGLGEGNKSLLCWKMKRDFKKNVFTICHNDVIMREAFKWLLKDGENGCMDWIEIKILKLMFQKYF